MRILVAGHSGQLAHALQRTPLPGSDWLLKTVGRPELDVTERESIERALDAFEPDIVVNAAAYTAVDKAEAEPRAAFAANEIGAGNLALETALHGIPIIHVSTDYVYSGGSDRPYVEADPTSPINIYGRSKLAGEKAVAGANPQHLVLRTSWVYSPWGNNFVKTMLRLGSERDALNIVGDQQGSPSYAPDLANAILAMAGKVVEDPSPRLRGVFHLTNGGITSWFGLAQEVFRAAAEFGVPSPALNAITTEEYPTPARRPRYSVLDNTRAEAAFGVRLRDWREAARECVRELLHPGG